MEETIAKLEYLLFISGEPLKIKYTANILNLNKEDLLLLIEEINKDYDNRKKGIYIKVFNKHIQFATNTRYQDILMNFFKKSKTKLLGNSTLEVLSAIAYKQPITRAEIDDLRGIKSDYSIRVLLERDLIEECGRLETVGNPKLYKTTIRFLRNFGLSSLDELPIIEE